MQWQPACAIIAALGIKHLKLRVCCRGSLHVRHCAKKPQAYRALFFCKGRRPSHKEWRTKKTSECHFVWYTPSRTALGDSPCVPSSTHFHPPTHAHLTNSLRHTTPQLPYYLHIARELCACLLQLNSISTQTHPTNSLRHTTPQPPCYLHIVRELRACLLPLNSISTQTHPTNSLRHTTPQLPCYLHIVLRACLLPLNSISTQTHPTNILRHTTPQLPCYLHIVRELRACHLPVNSISTQTHPTNSLRHTTPQLPCCLHIVRELRACLLPLNSISTQTHPTNSLYPHKLTQLIAPDTQHHNFLVTSMLRVSSVRAFFFAVSSSSSRNSIRDMSSWKEGRREDT